MKMKIIIILSLAGLIAAFPSNDGTSRALTEEEMEKVLADYSGEAAKLCNEVSHANWAVQTDVGNKENEQKQNEVSIKYAKFRKEKFEEFFKGVDESQFQKLSVQRQLKQVKEMGTALLEEKDLEELNTRKQKMASTYNSARICPFDKKNCDLAKEGLTLDPEIEKVLAESSNYEELEWAWSEWHKASGAKMKDDYKVYVDLMNKAAKANEYNDAGKMWQSRYEDPKLVETVDKLWDEVKPLYDELHKYVLNELKLMYGSKIDEDATMIPAHLLGNMWAQNWDNLYNRIKPYKNGAELDVSEKMVEDKYTPLKMFQESDNFYKSMGLPSSAMSYGDKAIIEKPTNRTIACHASAWDFCDGEDFRIKMCTSVNQEDFVVVHHEMGHIMYYIMYKDQPLLLRGGANPAFHEAVGDTIALSVSTPKHLEKINLLVNYKDTKEDNINALFKMALERVSFLPFGLLIDKWRWEVFSGDVKETDWNKRWWELRQQYQKVSPPNARTEEFFDPGAKYHVPADSQYIAYFLAHILEFQFYRSLCIEAKEYNPQNPSEKPLHKCDFYENKEAGNKLRAGLQLGMSQHWTVALEALTGEKTVNGSALLEYFKPLHDFLIESNKMNEVLKTHNVEASKENNKLVKAEWDVNTDIGNESKEKALADAVLATAKFNKEQYEKHFKDIDANAFGGEHLQRQLEKLSHLGIDALPADKLQNLTTATNNMQKIYNSAKICPFKNQNCEEKDKVLTLDPEMSDIMANSSDYDELLYVWKAWRDASGKHMREDYKNYVNIVNEAAKMNNLNDYGEMWRKDYEDEDFEETLERLWQEVKPLYDELHYYVKSALSNLYKDKMNKEDKLIPAHLLGNMWAQNWDNLYERIKPFTNGSSIDVTESMKAQGYTPLKMFQIADKFYTDLGMPSNNMSFDVSKGAIIEKPTDRIITCHASAWDFSDGEDFRVKMCTSVHMEDFITIHHELGHIAYYIQYKDQLISFREGANPGFHEAVGDLMALSVASPKHLEKIGLLKDYKDTKEDNINSLFQMALKRVAFLPFGLLIDKWRWDVFKGAVPEDQWNKHWWDLREKYQKVKAPVERSENDFDPGAKYHVPADSQYIAYFVAHILEFQLHKALCTEAGQYEPNNDDKPLHKCDIDGSKIVGQKLSKGLSIGSSKHWSEALKEMTGDTELSAQALIEYFRPLKEFLETFNQRTNDEKMTEILVEYDQAAAKMQNKLVKAEWAVATDTNNKEAAEAYSRAIVENSEFVNEWYDRHFKHYKPEDFEDKLIQRQIRLLTTRGLNTLPVAELENLNSARNRMETTYNTAKICPYDKKDCDLTKEGWTLDPEMDEKMAESEDYDELLYVWEAWRNASGQKMRKDYKTYVDLVNHAAVLDGRSDYGALWREDYEDEKLEESMDKLWSQVEPLYKELHTFVKRKLADKYSDKMSKDDEFIPAHLLGNMWAQTWENLYDRTKPYNDASSIDVTESLKEQKYDAFKMFEMSNKFFMDLGLPNNSMSYDVSKGAIIEKPSDRVITCHASAWDFFDGEDFRIKMCTTITMQDFITIHHEMGHINYFILYKGQPVPFKTSANPGFHEAVGDLMALSVATPKHLEKVGLLKDYKDSDEDNINSLYKMALERVAFLPFGLLIDKWRWDVFKGDVKEDQWNKHWWDLREKYQKVKAPIERSENDFDPGAKYHVPASSQYIAYFIAHILEFQLHRALCIEAGQYVKDDPEKPLHKCDIDGSLKVGEKLSKGLSLGYSEHWKVALKEMTGEDDISGEAVMDYFAPLYQYLKDANGVGHLTATLSVILVSLFACLSTRRLF